MSKKNPLSIKESDLDDFSSSYLDVFTPAKKGTKGKKPQTQKVQVKGAKDGEILKIKFEKKQLEVPEEFIYKQADGTKEVYKPREMFLNQFEGFKKLRGKYTKKSVDKLIAKKTKVPEFSFDRVELVKPKLKKLPTNLY